MKEESLGQIFKRYREADRIKLEKVEKDTKISKRVLLAIEADDYKNLADDLYTKNTIKAYARYLGLDYNKLLNLYDSGRKKITGQQESDLGVQKVKVYLTPQRARNVIILLIILILVGYLVFQVNNIYQPPKLEILQPEKNLILNQSYLEIIGKTEKEARIFINEKEIFLDTNGEFKASLDLQKGLNLITISAKKKQGQANTVYREILVQ